MRDSKWKYCSKEHSHNKIEFRNGIRGKNGTREDPKRSDLGRSDGCHSPTRPGRSFMDIILSENLGSLNIPTYSFTGDISTTVLPWCMLMIINQPLTSCSL